MPSPSQFRPKEKAKKTRKLSQVFSDLGFANHARTDQEKLGEGSASAHGITRVAPDPSFATHRGGKRLVKQPSLRVSARSSTAQADSLERSLPSSRPSALTSPTSYRATKISPLSSIVSPIASERSEQSWDDELGGPIPKSQEQLQRARLAKLARHLGEDIPPELVILPSVGRSPNAIKLPRARPATMHERRKSLDVSLLAPAKPLPSYSHTTSENSQYLKRSKSLRASKEEQMKAQSELPEKHNNLGDKSKLLGDKSSREAIQGTRAGPERRMRDTAQAGNIENPDTPIAPSQECQLPPSSAFSHDLPLEPSSDVPAVSDKTITSQLADVTVQPHSDQGDSHMAKQGSSPHPPAPPRPTHSTPRPFPTVGPLPRRPATADGSDSANTFKARRRRAEKLANFFGVDYQDLSATGILECDPVVEEASAADVAADSPAPFSPPPTSASVQVDVKVSKPSRFWNFMDGRNSLRHANVDDVIGQLRAMKAST
ncbi:hypothetical protein SERLA73DRAFT_174564 [Serpula lacrymans var. lacrymans S7.3]|uniref:Uncharacterized protein n=2 Tax=Serpula lacrymans var. lacrymans TaxID=341189 RepID=F8PGJ1_SERL3|nr:uncharacterized protein SERLADRAFT_456164 [Serpula lacrymans var. lacrymans S7.9]EGO05424.1 hypothetical protein SERLA73DRAFT_174564 [Serpula lacrymans var. lacrymans S7.3]EGO31271.1 hypothetical protein SERLADRAFT_456164 [Serpula lacrymans var. lacrymans S7.9]